MGFARYARSLVRRFQDEPFAMFGVNSDSSPETVSEVKQQENFTWDSIFDGGGTGGPIATRWDVHVWPTIYVIDHRGIIRWKGHGIPHDGWAEFLRLLSRAEEYSIKLREEIRKEPDYADVKGRLDAVLEERSQYYPSTDMHGWVWVYLRR